MSIDNKKLIRNRKCGIVDLCAVIEVMNDDKTCINRSTRFVIPSVAKNLTACCGDAFGCAVLFVRGILHRASLVQDDKRGLTFIRFVVPLGGNVTSLRVTKGLKHVYCAA